MPSKSTFGGALWGSRLFGGGSLSVEMFSGDLAVFDRFSLSDGTSLSVRQIINSGPTREINKASVPRADGEFLNGVFYRNRDITIIGQAKASTAAAFNQLLDTMKERLRTEEGELDITETGLDPRRYIGTLQNYDEIFAQRDYYHITYLPFQAKFYCRPFGYARDYTTTSVDLSASPTTEVLENTGTVEAKPVFTLIFTAASSVTAVNVKRVDSDGTTLDEIECGAVSAGDILTFDSENMSVTKNGTEVDFTGAFPLLDVGSNLIKFTVTGSSFAAYATLKYKPTYL
jgi:phage-related protein